MAPGISTAAGRSASWVVELHFEKALRSPEKISIVEWFDELRTKTALSC